MTQVVDVFIASPGDVQAERDLARQAVQDVSVRTRELLDIILHPVSWQHFLPLASRRDDEPVQDRFTSLVRKSGIFVGILYQRYGTEIDESRQLSGTDEEFQTALKHRRSIEILTYFRNPPATVPNDPELLSQAIKLADLKKRLERAHVLSRPYAAPEDFYPRLLVDLFAAVVRISRETERRDQYRAFFRFGADDRKQTPFVLLGYPAIHEFTQQAPPAAPGAARGLNWTERLLPNVIYEDFKAIQKIEAAVRLSGARIASVTLDHPRLADRRPANRIWLCLPRNERAQSHLKQLRDRPRFRFDRPADASRHDLIWRAGDGSEVRVRSPLGLYLERQRLDACRPWRREFGEIVGRDYAVISRFARPSAEQRTTGREPYQHYFIAGIRGLGTWGAGWFLDRRPDELERLAREAGHGDAQALIEVTFANFRIVEARDVSGFAPEYFREQLRSEVVGQTIDDHL